MKKSSKQQAPSTSSSAPTVAQPVQQVPLLYADSVGNVIMSPTNSRVTLVLNVGPAKDGVQPAVPAIELVIPTPALLAFGKQLQELLRARGADLARAYEQTSKQFQ